jgi:hypothetical protein
MKHLQLQTFWPLSTERHEAEYSTPANKIMFKMVTSRGAQCDHGSFSDFSKHGCGILLHPLHVYYMGYNNFIQLIWVMHLAANYH